jgi:hypothetical protein
LLEGILNLDGCTAAGSTMRWHSCTAARLGPGIARPGCSAAGTNCSAAGTAPWRGQGRALRYFWRAGCRVLLRPRHPAGTVE